MLNNDPNRGAETRKMPSVPALERELLKINSEMSCNPHSCIPLLAAIRSGVQKELAAALEIERRDPNSARQLAGKGILAPNEPARC